MKGREFFQERISAGPTACPVERLKTSSTFSSIRLERTSSRNWFLVSRYTIKGEWDSGGRVVGGVTGAFYLSEFVVLGVGAFGFFDGVLGGVFFDLGRDGFDEVDV